ncbi:MAG: nuclear transport factor 2 family protein [Chloroflexota bacterium]
MGTGSQGSRIQLEAAQRAFDDLFRHDAGAALAGCFADDAQLLWPEQPAIAGPEAIGEAFAEFVAGFETISFEPMYDLVAVEGPLAAVVGSFIETRRSRREHLVERVYGRLAYTWRLDAGKWRVMRLMTSRYAPTEVVVE